MAVRFAPAVVLAIAAAIGILSPGDAPAAETDRPDAVPYRPTVSTPVALTAPGWIEAELGTLYVRDRHTEDGADRRWSVPYTFKYAFSEDWGVRIGGEAFVRAHGVDGTREGGFGDTAIVGKRRFAIDSTSAFGLEAGVLVPSARRGLETGSGKADWSLNGIYSADFAAWHADFNLVDTRVGARQPGESRLQTLAALAISHPVGSQWTAAAELSGARRTGTNGVAQVLAAMSCAIRRDIVLDFGAAHGLNRATPTWQAFGGVTMVLGRLD